MKKFCNVKIVSGIDSGMRSHGVYTSEGEAIREAQLIQGETIVNGHAPSSILNNVDSYIAGSYIYGGIAVGHFGHALLETFARLHVFRASSDTILFSSLNRTNNKLFWELVRAFGLPEERILVVDEPCIVECLYISPANFTIRRSISPVFVEEYERIGRAFGFPENVYEEPIYLSRTKTNKLKRYFFGESIVEEVLAKSGVKIIHLESMAVRDQIMTVMSHRIIVGFEGTAFHHLLFASKPKDVIYFGVRKINKNFTLIEKEKNNNFKSIVINQDSEVENILSMYSGELHNFKGGPFLLSKEAIVAVCDACGVAIRPQEINDRDIEDAREEFHESIKSISGNKFSGELAKKYDGGAESNNLLSLSSFRVLKIFKVLLSRGFSKIIS